ncbi:helix-turn-helix domain-containing protein [Polymorphospora sp. NPDC051019]|uniref:helix-turn-helix domain-containing protein n=1 Tax=Polymorphospora sp. NPDC051019 TaxID=3155725 RepID=UPI003435DB54
MTDSLATEAQPAERRTRALAMRAAGRSVPKIADELQVARSTVYGWVRHIPVDPERRAEHRRAHAKVMTDARWAGHHDERARRRAVAHDAVRARIGVVGDRDLMLAGAVIYWSEGRKSKPWRRDERVTLTNSDPRLVELFLRFLAVCGIERDVPHYRVSIHESADVTAAEAWWVEVLQLPAHRFRRATLKRHRPTTTRHNTGDDYHGCLVVEVPRSRELYWTIEGIVDAAVGRRG